MARDDTYRDIVLRSLPRAAEPGHASASGATRHDAACLPATSHRWFARERRRRPRQKIALQRITMLVVMPPVFTHVATRCLLASADAVDELTEMMSLRPEAMPPSPTLRYYVFTRCRRHARLTLVTAFMRAPLVYLSLCSAAAMPPRYHGMILAVAVTLIETYH